MSSYALWSIPYLGGGESAEAERILGGVAPHDDDAFSRSILDRVLALAALEDAFREAQTKNWDREGSEPADPLSFGYAIQFLEQLPSWATNPDVALDPDGEFSLEWDSGRRWVFSVSLGRDGTLSYAGLFGAAKRHGVEPFADEIPEVILTFIRQVTASATESPLE